MRKFAGTFHRNGHDEWVACMTEDGRPCSRHAGGEHIKGATLEDALTAYYATIFTGGYHEDMDAADYIHIVDADVDIHDVARMAFPEVERSDDDTGLSRAADEAWNGMDDDQRGAVLDYTDHMFEPVSRYLTQSDERPDAAMDGYIHTLHTALDSCSTDDDMVVYRRRFSSHDHERERDAEELLMYDAIEHGDGTVVKTNFNSTTTRPDAIGVGAVGGNAKSNDTAYVIRIPKGTSGMYVNDYSYHRDEYEFLVDKGMRYRVVGIYERGVLYDDGDGHESWDVPPIIALEVVPPSRTVE